MPVLALALASAAQARFRLRDDGLALARSFVSAVSAMDAADRTYRTAIERELPRKVAHALLEAMAGFRAEVVVVRNRARAELSQMYAGSGRTYGPFDPLDTFVPPPIGLSHVDGTRSATIADAARSRVDDMRASVNERIVRELDDAQIALLIAAKRRRLRAFEDAVSSSLLAGLPAGTIGEPEFDRLAVQLAQLADGWY